MENAFTKAEEMVRTARQYINARIKSLKLEIAEKLADAASAVIAGALLLAGIVVFMLFAGIAFSILIGQWLGYLWLGFMITGVLNLFIFMVFWKIRKKIIGTAVKKQILKELVTDEE
jgi:hypothetical protein